MASWEEYARGSADAALWRLKGVSAAVFPRSPEREIYNNALLDRDLAPPERGAAVDAMHAAYAAVGIDSYAAWVHESDHGMRTELAGRGYTVDESTRAMGISLDDISVAVPDLDLGPPDWAEVLRILGVPVGLLGGADPHAFHILVARLAGENVATGLAFDHDGDCGVFNVTTLEAARRRGLGTALTARLVHDGVERLLDREPAVHRDGRKEGGWALTALWRMVGRASFRCGVCDLRVRRGASRRSRASMERSSGCRS